MANPPRIALFPGTFDPITNGHIDVIQRGMSLFDRVIVAIGNNPGKVELFSTEERVAMISEIVAEMNAPNLSVESFKGLTVDFAKSVNAVAILRGLRNTTDLHYEFDLALTNRAVADIETIFIMTGDQYGFTSSSLIRQIAAGGSIDRLHKLLPSQVIEKLKEKRRLHGDRMALLRTDDLKE